MEGRARGAALRAPVWALGLWALAGWDAAVAVLPALGVLRGPLGTALLALGAGLLCAGPAGERLGRLRLPRPAMPWALVAVALVGIGQHYASGLRVSGDEPHYLLMAQSLWREGDLDLRDNFTRGDFREYVPALPAPHYAAPRADGRPFPAHSPGLPALLAPLYALGGRRACLVALAVAGALLFREVRGLAGRVTGEASAAAWAGAAALGPPALFYSFHVYTELPSALAAVVAVRLLSGPPGVGAACAAAACVSLLPWLHPKMAAAAAVLGAVAFLRLRGRPLATFLAVSGTVAAAYLAFYARVFGAPTPLAVYGGVPRDMDGAPLAAVAGLMLDRSFGLLPVAPLFLLALPGLAWVLGRARHGEVVAHLALGAALLAPLLPWRMWWGGQCPPGRFLVPLVPLLSVAVGARLAGPPTGLARWRWPLAAATAALGLFMVARPEAMLLLNRRDRPTRVWDALSREGGAQVGWYLPSLVAPDAAEVRTAALWIAALLLLVVLDALAAQRERVDRLFRGLGLPVALALGIGAAVDLWARAPGNGSHRVTESPERDSRGGGARGGHGLGGLPFAEALRGRDSVAPEPVPARGGPALHVRRSERSLTLASRWDSLPAARLIEGEGGAEGAASRNQLCSRGCQRGCSRVAS